MSASTAVSRLILSPSAPLARRYVEAWLDLAEERGEMDRAQRDGAILEDALAHSALLRDVLRSPRAPRDRMAKLMAALGVELGLAPLTIRLLMTLAEGRRLGVLPVLLAVFNVDRAARLGEVTVRAEVARPLTRGQKDRLETLLKGRFGPRYRLEIVEDPAALGGFVLRVNSQLIDASLRGKLAHLAQGLAGPPPRAS